MRAPGWRVAPFLVLAVRTAVCKSRCPRDTHNSRGIWTRFRRVESHRAVMQEVPRAALRRLPPARSCWSGCSRAAVRFVSAVCGRLQGQDEPNKAFVLGRQQTRCTLLVAAIQYCASVQTSSSCCLPIVGPTQPRSQCAGG